MLKKFPVMEIFGPTIQGEGIMCGKQTMFIRFGGCDYRCTKCDSLHAVIPKLIKAGATYMTAEEIVNDISSMENAAPWVTISGGNPLMHDLTDVVRLLKEKGFKVAVETQGTIYRDWLLECQSITVSPKGPGMGETTDFNTLGEFYSRVEGNVQECCLKVVIFDDEDIAFAEEVRTVFQQPIYLSLGNPYPPNNPDAEDLDNENQLVSNLLTRYKELADKLYARPILADCIFLPQLHVLIYGNEMGR